MWNIFKEDPIKNSIYEDYKIWDEKFTGYISLDIAKENREIKDTVIDIQKGKKFKLRDNFK